MADLRAGIRNWLFEEFSSQLATVFEAMAGERPAVDWAATGSAPAETMLRWRQSFSGAPGEVWIAAAESDWTAAGGHIQRAAGIAKDDPAGFKATYLDTICQALSGLAQAMTARLAAEVKCDAGKEVIGAAIDVRIDARGDAAYADVHLALGATMPTVVVGLDNVLVDKFIEVQVVHSAPGPPAETQPGVPAPVPQSQTLDLLLDVELPVSISFGRAQVQLREALKLITGSIVELNRSISEPVEVIVNNCVIARGEVVVVEGNFGVRIQQVISRQERLRSLH